MRSSEQIKNKAIDWAYKLHFAKLTRDNVGIQLYEYQLQALMWVLDGEVDWDWLNEQLNLQLQINVARA